MNEKNLHKLKSVNNFDTSSNNGNNLAESAELNPMVFISKIGSLFKRSDGRLSLSKDDFTTDSRLLANSFYTSRLKYKLYLHLHIIYNQKKNFKFLFDSQIFAQTAITRSQLSFCKKLSN